MEASWQLALAYLTVLIGVGEAFSRTFGPTQERLTEAVIQAFAVKSRYKPAVNHAVAIAVTAAATVVLAAASGSPSIIPGGILVGLMSARVAGDIHDQRESGSTPDTPTSRQ